MSDEWDAAEASVERAAERREQADEKAARIVLTGDIAPTSGAVYHRLSISPLIGCDCGWTCPLPEDTPLGDAVAVWRAHARGGGF